MKDWLATLLPTEGLRRRLEISGGPEFKHSESKLTFAGDVWISNRKVLCDKYKIKTSSQSELVHSNDTELDESILDLAILADLWSLKGEKILDEVQGGYAFLVSCEFGQTLQIVRDPIGVKSIYIARQDSKFFIANTLRKAAASLVSKEIDLMALRDYLCCSFVPGNQTMFKNVRELRPGEIITLPEYRSRFFWSVKEDYLELENESLDWHAERLRRLLEEVVTEYLPANEDVGCYLSGGVDSSSIAALAKVLEQNLSGNQVHCYSIHFGTECPNELEFSTMMATHCGASHDIIEITQDKLWDLHRESISLLDDPIGDPLTVPNLILARKAKQVTPVILNGEGGDPCFGGPKNQPMMLASLYGEAMPSHSQIEDAYLASFQKCKSDLPRLLKPKVWNEVKEKSSVFADDLGSAGHYVNKLLLINTKFKGADQILSKVHSISSATGIEGRSPFFDRRIVEASLTIPPQYKLKGAQEKAVLKRALQDLLPEPILNRPKSGMMVPVQLFFRKYWQKQARDLLLSRNSCISEFLNTSLISDWLDYKDDLWGRYGVKLWLVCALELWLKENIK